jgi:hypothetical protein
MIVEMKLTIDTNDAAEVRAVNTFLSSANALKVGGANKKIKRLEASCEEQEPGVTEVAAEQDDVSAEDLKSLIASKVKNHRPEITAKVRELGGTSLNSLPKIAYGEFFDFLKAL